MMTSKAPPTARNEGELAGPRAEIAALTQRVSVIEGILTAIYGPNLFGSPQPPPAPPPAEPPRMKALATFAHPFSRS